MCEVLWDVTGESSVLAYERGYEYNRSVGGFPTAVPAVPAGHSGGLLRVKPLVLVEELPDLKALVLQLVDAACEEVELEQATQQKAATLMQKLARGGWGRRRIRRLRVVASCREVYY